MHSLPIMPNNMALKGIVVAGALVLSLAEQTYGASRMSDWQCLTSDFYGSEAARQQYIASSRYASGVFGIAPSILVAIKRVESGRGLDPMVVGHNTNGTTDRGFYQVNTDVWLPVIQKAGVSQFQTKDLHGVRQNAVIAAWVLKRQMNRRDVGNTLDAVGHYHKGGGNGPSARRIRNAYTSKFMKKLRGMMARCG